MRFACRLRVYRSCCHMQRRLISDEEPASRISLQLLGLHGHLAMRMALSSQSERESISEPKEASGCLREIVTAYRSAYVCAQHGLVRATAEVRARPFPSSPPEFRNALCPKHFT